MSFGNTVKTGSGTAYWLLVDSEGRLVLSPDSSIVAQTSDLWIPEQVAEVTPAPSQLLTVTALKKWRIQMIWVEITTDATVTARLYALTYKDDSGNVIGIFTPGSSTSESATTYLTFSPTSDAYNANVAGAFDELIGTKIPDVVLPAGYTITVDNLFGDVAGDDIIVRAMVLSADA